MERETKTITTPKQNKTVVINTYLTGREFEYAQAPLLEAMAVRPQGAGGDIKFGNIDVNKVQEATHRLIEKHVVSVDGKSEKVLDAILDMHHDDYQFVVDELQELSKKN
jgi:hypothetical protein